MKRGQLRKHERRCAFYEDDSRCRQPPVERLYYCNPRIGFEGYYGICSEHLRTHMAEHLLATHEGLSK